MSQAAEALAEEPLNPYRWWILVGLITAAVMEVLDTTIVNVSMPQIAGNLGATTEEVGWISTGYILSNVIVLPLTAWLASRFGRRLYLSASILVFIGASVLCGTSRSLEALVLWRIVQGAGGAALLSTAQATIREIFPREQQGLVQSVYMLGIIVAPTIGPTVGGSITDNFGWHWIFLINLPIGIVSFLLVFSFLKDSRYGMRVDKVDWVGIAMLAVGLGCLQYVLEEGNAKAWFESPVIGWLTVVAVSVLPTFVWWQLSPKNATPVVGLKVLKNRDLSAALVLFIVLGFGLYGGVFIYPMFAQNVMRLTPTQTGLTLLPGGIMTGFAAVLSGRLLGGAKPVFDPKVSIVAGLGVYCVAMSAMSTMPSMAGYDNVLGPLLLRGLGLGMLFVPINLAAFSSLRGAEIAQGSGLLNLARQLGGSFGIAAIGSFVTQQLHTARAGLVEHVNLSSPAAVQRIGAATHALAQRGVPPEKATQAAYALIDRTLMTEAATKAYNSAFLLILIVSVVASPAILVLRNRKDAPGPAAAVEAH
ncbi:MAG: DHA2 family efflux MFS transporter permease subunit [Armatimonadetes bacterium]|nr:DHA2 family efflux MFS transporter permease subunit [Armatimonadota bacterium]